MAHSETSTGTYSLRTVGTEGKQRYWLVAVSSIVALVASLAGAVMSPEWSIVATALMVAIIAWGWPAASGLTDLRGAKWVPAHNILFAACGWVSCAVVYYAPVGRLLTLLPAVVAVGIVVAFLMELLRGEGAAARLESIITASVGVLTSVSAAGWVGMSLVHRHSHAPVIVWGSGVVVAICIGIVGARMIFAGPSGGPRRGAMTLGVTPVAFLGILGYAGAIFIERVIV
ncbi:MULTISPECIES: hypothetical protein [Kocuria]|uniref:hypothetical protein n=1 Tax=Kocuria TaxID=57493 RepID=UPI00065FD611|nr:MULTISPECIES: hypothetical protein [Kocuria]RUQ23354.1 hypothetical protein D8M21_01205 [Kocuria sp. HSID16901]